MRLHTTDVRVFAVRVSGPPQHGQQCGEATCHLSRMSAASALQRLPDPPDPDPTGEGLRRRPRLAAQAVTTRYAEKDQ